MLPRSDQAIVGRDPDLPGLGLVLDAGALAARLGTGALTPQYLCYKPGTSAVASFRPAEGDGGLDAFAVKAYPAERFDKVRRRSEWRSGPDPVRLLAAEQIALFPLRRDRDLTALRRIADPEGRVAFLRALLGQRSELADGALTLLRYKPGRRLVARLDHAGTPAAVVKAYTAEDFPRALDGAATAAALGGAPLRGVCLESHVVVCGWIEGRTLCPLATEAVRRTGAWLARLHATQLGMPHDGAAPLARIVADLAALAPDLAERAAPVAAAVERALVAHAGAAAPIHGDFSADQVILRDGAPIVVDWDRVASGDPGRDLGSFLARLDAEAIDGLIAPAAAIGAGEALRAGYAAERDLPASAPLHHARALILLSTEAFRQRAPRWPERTERLLAQAEALLAEPRRPAPGADLPMLAEALDARAMRPRLAAALGIAPEALRLETPWLLRATPGRRALVEYRGTAAGSEFALLGKLRAKGPDVHAPELHRALRLQGLDGAAPQRVGVPESRARIDGLHLWLQERVPGLVVTGLLRPDGPVEPARRVGAALARLHGAQVEPPRRWSMADEGAVLERALEAAAAAMPAERARIRAIAAAAMRLLAELEPAPATGIHRDFYPDQVLLGGATVWIVDLDLYAQGDPAIDVGNFLAHVSELALRRHGAADTLACHEAAFLDGYCHLAPGIDPARVTALKTVSLARHIHISTRIPERRHVTAALIDHIEAALGAGRVLTEPAGRNAR
jgi:aminoglycoside phosphotransferase (APT) family kinase protein